MPERHASGVLDTCTYIDLAVLDPAGLPAIPEITAAPGGRDGQRRGDASGADRDSGAAIVDFDPLPFDAEAATRYGTLVALALAAKRDWRPRRIDLMTAAIASDRRLPLYTRNAADFTGLADMVEVVTVR